MRSFPTISCFYPSALGCGALGWKLLLGVLSLTLLPTLVQGTGASHRAAQGTPLTALGKQLLYACLEQACFGITVWFFLQKWVDFVAGLAAFLCTWILAFPVEEFVVSKTLIALV